jgi:MoaA/NifB/PqqE/SkfB family radical SAM enzyme
LDSAEQPVAVAPIEPLATDPHARFGKAFCVAAWRNLNIAIGGDARPCCEFKGDFGHVARQSIDEIWHGKEFRDFRATLLRDERDERCSKCYEVEDTGGQSLRTLYNIGKALHADQIRGYAGDIDGSADPLAPPLPIDLDLRFSNLCNFSCRTCGHSASTRWFSEARKLGWAVAPQALIKSFDSTELAMQALGPLLPKVEQLYFAGGEPLLLAEHYAILHELLAQGRTDVMLVYNSNMSDLRLGKLDVPALWSRFSDVTIQVSIDGSGARGELIREGLSWSRFVANLAAVRDRCPHVRMRFGVTVSIFNVWVLPDLYRDLLALGCAGARDFHFHVLQEPDYYSIQILPRGLKLEVARRLESGAAARPSRDAGDAPRNEASDRIDESIQDQFRHIVDHMMAEDRTDLIHVFQCVTSRLDGMRGESTAAICPELAPLLRFSWLARLRGAVDVVSRRVASLKAWLAHA